MAEKELAGKSGRWSLFFTGLAIGLALGGAAMWWAENFIRYDQGVTLYQYNPLETNEKEQALIDLDGKSAVDLSGDAQDSSSLPDLSALPDTSLPEEGSYDWLGQLDTMGSVYYTPESYGPEDLLDDYRQWPSQFDTLRSGGAKPADLKRIVQADDATVLRDELLFVKQLMVMEESADAEGNVLRKPYGNKPLRVEFWKSPVNYSGYRLTESRLVLFGVFAIDSVNLIQREDALWLVVMGDRFSLKETYDFKPLIRSKPTKTKQTVTTGGRQ